MNSSVPETNEDGHEEINLDNISELSVKNGELYWQKNRLKTESVQHFALTIWQGSIALLVAVASIAGPVVTYLANLENICKATSDKVLLCPFKPVATKPPLPQPPASTNTAPAAPQPPAPVQLPQKP